MFLEERLEKDYIVAYKAKDAVRLNVLRFLKTALKNYRVEHLKDPDDSAVLDVIQKQCKQRQDSIEQYTMANRPELAEKEAQELQALLEYMPKQLTTDELASAIRSAIETSGASTMKDMGKVMQLLTATHKGSYDGKIASDLVKQALSALG